MFGYSALICLRDRRRERIGARRVRGRRAELGLRRQRILVADGGARAARPPEQPSRDVTAHRCLLARSQPSRSVARQLEEASVRSESDVREWAPTPPTRPEQNRRRNSPGGCKNGANVDVPERGQTREAAVRKCRTSVTEGATRDHKSGPRDHRWGGAILPYLLDLLVPASSWYRGSVRKSRNHQLWSLARSTRRSGYAATYCFRSRIASPFSPSSQRTKAS